MSSRSLLKVAVEAAEEELKRHIGLTTSTDHPYLLLTQGLKCVENVRDCWLEDRTNLERVEAQTGKTFKPNPRENVVDTFPVVFTNTPGSGFLPGPFPNKYLVIMAIGGLDRDNGAATTGREKLESGEYVVLPGHQQLWFNAKGGGVAVFVVVDMNK